MSRAIPDPKTLRTCWDCGAANRADARECWLCRRRDWKPSPTPPDVWSEATPDPSPSRGVARPSRAARALASIALLGIVSAGVYVFVTFVLPVLVFFALVIAMLIALFQVCFRS